MQTFEQVREHIADAYRALSKNLSEDKEGPDGTFPGMSTWDVLYGLETRQVMTKLQEAMMWLREAEESVG